MIQEVANLYAARRDFFLELIFQHIQISLTAICISAILGLALGVLVSNTPRAAPVVLGFINVAYTIPSISLLGLLIPLTGIGDKTAIVALTVYGLLPMVRNTYTGLTTVDGAVTEAAKGMGSTSAQILWKIKLPLAMPIILSGLRNMVVMTIALSGISAFIGAGGLGVAIYRGITTNNAAMTVAGSLLIAAVALVSDFLLGRVEKHLKRKWRLI